MWRVLFLSIVRNSAYSHTRSQSQKTVIVFYSMTHTDIQGYVGKPKPTKLCSQNTLFNLIRFTTELQLSTHMPYIITFSVILETIEQTIIRKSTMQLH